jgi:hypothetical protein
VGRTLLCRAMSLGIHGEDMCHLLIKHGARVDFVDHVWGWTALHYASRMGR